jgi:hypothetical protein
MCHSSVFVLTCVFALFYVPATTICDRTRRKHPRQSVRTTAYRSVRLLILGARALLSSDSLGTQFQSRQG